MLQKINFLPYRDLQKQDQKAKFKNTLIFIGFLGIATVFVTGYVFDLNIEKQIARNTFLEKETTKLDEQLVEVANLRNEIKELEIQRDTVYALQNNRTQAVELAEMFTRRVPEEVYLSEANQAGDRFTIKGIANSNERVSQMMRNLEQVQWVRGVTLLQTKSVKVDDVSSATGMKTQRTLFEFSISFDRVVEEPPKADKDGSKNNPNNANNTRT
jgi:type IV pilus assembly protein PilN